MESRTPIPQTVMKAERAWARCLPTESLSQPTEKVPSIRIAPSIPKKKAARAVLYSASTRNSWSWLNIELLFNPIKNTTMRSVQKFFSL